MIENAKYTIEHGKGLRPLLAKIRKNCLEVYKRSLTYNSAGLLAAMVIGDKTGLSATLEDELRFAGLSHIAVVSGFNITLIYNFISKFCLYFTNKRKSTILGSICVWMFVLLVGFEAPVMRAAIFLRLVSVGEFCL